MLLVWSIKLHICLVILATFKTLTINKRAVCMFKVRNSLAYYSEVANLDYPLRLITWLQYCIMLSYDCSPRRPSETVNVMQQKVWPFLIIISHVLHFEHFAICGLFIQLYWEESGQRGNIYIDITDGKKGSLIENWWGKVHISVDWKPGSTASVVGSKIRYIVWKHV